jgi:hypothetical protein
MPAPRSVGVQPASIPNAMQKIAVRFIAFSFQSLRMGHGATEASA